MKSALYEMHDILRNRTALNYPSGRQLTYELDELDRVQTMTENVGATIGRPVAEYAYQGPFRIKTRKSGNGTQLDIAYDAMCRITSYTNTVETRHGVSLPQPERIAGFEYGYNNEGMRTYENYQPGVSETTQNFRAKVFTYDSLYQITGVKYDVPDPLVELQNPESQTYSKQVTYDFDNSGNRNAVETTRWGVSPISQSYQTNTLNQYTTIDSSVFDYDSAGNMTEGIIYLDDLQNPGQKTPVQAQKSVRCQALTIHFSPAAGMTIICESSVVNRQSVSRKSSVVSRQSSVVSRQSSAVSRQSSAVNH